MEKWIKCPAYHTNEGLTVYEVKCPVCGNKETFHTSPHGDCYVCGTELQYIKEDPEA